MIKIKYDADAKHDFKHPKCDVDYKESCTFEIEYAMGVLLDIIMVNDKDTNVEKVFKEVGMMRNEIAKVRKGNECNER